MTVCNAQEGSSPDSDYAAAAVAAKSLQVSHKFWYIFGHGDGLVTKSCLTLVTPWMVACQALLSMGFSRQAYWSGLPFPSAGDLPEPGIEPRSPALQADSLQTEL